MGTYSSGNLQGIEFTRQVGLPTAEIHDIFIADDQGIYLGDDQDFTLEYDATAGQALWRFPTAGAPNEPVINLFTGAIGETVTTPTATLLTNTEPTICLWGGAGTAANYTFVQGGTGIASGTTRFSARTASLGVDIDINVVSPVIDIGADVLATGTFIDIAYDTGQTLAAGTLRGIDIDFATNITGASTAHITGYELSLPAYTQVAAATTEFSFLKLAAIGALGTTTAAGTLNFFGLDLSDSIGAITTNFAGSAINWRGIYIISPATTQTLGTATVIGLDLDMDATVTTGGTITGINLLMQNTYTSASEIGIIVQGDARLTHINTTTKNLLTRPTTVDTGVDVSIDSLASPIIDIGADILDTGTFINIAYTTAETLAAGTLRGVDIDFATNITGASTAHITGYELSLPAYTQTAAATTEFAFLKLAAIGALGTTTAAGTLSFFGLDLSDSIGAITSNFAGSAINWRGIYIISPATTQTLGIATVIGLDLDMDAVVTTGGTITGINLIMQNTYTSASEIGIIVQGDARLTHINTTAKNLLTRPTTADTGVDVAIDSLASPIIDIGADIFEGGTFIDIGYDTAETLSSALTGMRMNLNTSVTVNSGGAVRAIRIDLPAHTQSAAATATFTGYSIESAGVLQTDTAAGTINYTVIDLDTGVTAITTNFAGSAINWRGIDIRSPATTQTLGIATVIGLDLDMDAVVTTGGTITGINLIMQNTYTSASEIGIIVQGDARLTHINTTAKNLLTRPTTADTGVDVAIDSLASPIIDIGADVFSQGTFLNLAYTTAETLDGTLIGASFNLNTSVTTFSGGTVRGIDIALPAHTQSVLATATITGFRIASAGNLLTNTAAGTINWRGIETGDLTTTITSNFAASTVDFRAINLLMPNVTQTLGTANAYGIYLQTGTITTGGVNQALRIDNRAASGTIVNITHGATTLIGTATGINLSYANVTTGGAGTGNITGYALNFNTIAFNAAYDGAVRGIDILMNPVNTDEVLRAIDITLPATATSNNINGIIIAGDVPTGGTSAMIQLNPSVVAGAVTNTMINLLTAGTLSTNTFRGINFDFGSLDPSGAAVVVAQRMDLSGVAVTNAPSVVGIDILMPATYTGHASGQPAIRISGTGGTIGMLDLNPSGTGSQNVIDITPSAALAAGSAWRGILLIGNTLDPAAGAASTIIGYQVDFESLVGQANSIITGIRMGVPDSPIGTWNAIDIYNASGQLLFAISGSGLLDMNPRGTGTQNVIDITPAVALAAGSSWTGIKIDGTSLDPATGVQSNIYGIDIDFTGIISFDTNDALNYGVLFRPPAGDSARSVGFITSLSELTVAGTQISFWYSGGAIALSATATYRGLWVDYDELTRDAGAPVLEGIRIDWLGNYTGFGNSYAMIISDGAWTQSTAVTTTKIISYITGGALTQDTLVGTMYWQGYRVDIGALAQNTGTIYAYGFHVGTGQLTTGGSVYGYSADMSGHTNNVGASYGIYVLSGGTGNGLGAFFGRTTAFTGVAAATGYEVRIDPNFTLTEPAGGTYTHYGLSIELDGIAVTAGVGTSALSCLNLIRNADADAGNSVHILMDLTGYIATGSGIVRFRDMDDSDNTLYLEIQTPTDGTYVQLVESGNTKQVYSGLCSFVDATYPVISKPFTVIGQVGLAGTEAAGTLAAAAGTAGRLQFNATADDVTIAFPLNELQVDTGTAADFRIGFLLDFPAPAAAADVGHFTIHKSGKNGTWSQIKTDTTITSTGDAIAWYWFNVGDLAFVKGDTLIIYISNFNDGEGAPGAIIVDLYEVQLEHKVGIENDTA